MNNEVEELIEKNENVKSEDVIKEEKYERYLKDFVMPLHSKKCKKCYGLGRIGFEYDPITKERGGLIPCPKYQIEIEKAFRNHVEEVNKRMGIEKQKEPETFDDLMLRK